MKLKTFVNVAIAGILKYYSDGFTLNDVESFCKMLNECKLFNLGKEELHFAIIEVIRKIY